MSDKPEFPEELIERCAKRVANNHQCRSFDDSDRDDASSVLRESGHAELVAALCNLMSLAERNGMTASKQVSDAWDVLRKAGAL